jgi:prevent-host-death family protein
MVYTFPMAQASGPLAELVDRALHGHERVVLTEHGQPAAVLISVDELDELERTQDAADIALCTAIKARNEPGMRHEEFMAALDTEDLGPSSG